MKISDKIDLIRNNEATKDNVLYSFEYFPPLTDKGIEKLYDRIERMSSINPLWIDVTWRGGSTSQITLEMCQHAQMFTGLDVMMHLTCTNMTKADLDNALNKCQEYGVRNILALRGDPPKEGEELVNDCHLEYGVDLIKYIKENYGDYFCIGVAGYPETHLEATSPEDDLKYLKDKIDAGGDLIITQLFYDNEAFFEYESKCRDLGITVPIIPGLLPIVSYSGFQRMTTLCQTRVPKSISDRLEEVKHDDSKVKEFGVDLTVEMCQELMEKGVKFLHFYTLNLEKSVVDTVMKLGIMKKKKSLPWKKPSFKDRSEESVRPIFWANKPKSYIARTKDWDEFPNGRWGVSRSPAFGDMGEYPSMSKLYKKSTKQLKKLWGEEYNTEREIGNLIISYIKGNTKRLPWCEEKIQDETSTISEYIEKLNTNYLFTVNSQPKCNSVPSHDSVFGWGPDGGYVYQKEYIEFLIPKFLVEPLKTFLESYRNISYQGVNSSRDEFSNVASDSVNAVTWGVFPGQEVAQPTVVDHTAFYLWSEELFQHIKEEWIPLYEKESKTSEVLTSLHDNYYLVNIVDNDFVNGDLQEVIEKFISENLEAINSYEE
ncbi:unnamed protein product [Moneuplotes crassus]|uniref:MTHFR SAM-binding regulatory domain-containing protein n=1 Tax=Euplotes crassus TaxID=5936 RepID=A0AAD1U1Q3_EUPCR|nr:unnamed protein product [Moneuplotes crassus]